MWVNIIIIMLDVSSHKSTPNYIFCKNNSKIRKKHISEEKDAVIECQNLDS